MKGLARSARSRKLGQRDRFASGGASALPPVNLTPPALSGVLEVGEDLTCSDGAWSEAVTLTRQWRRTDADISGETGATHTQVVADIGPELVCRVTATSVASGLSTVVDTAPVRYTPLELGEMLELFSWIPWERAVDDVPASAQELAENAGAVDNDPIESITDWSGTHTISQAVVSQRARLRTGAAGIADLDALFFDGDDSYSVSGVNVGYSTQIFVARDVSGTILLEHNLADSSNRAYHTATADARVYRGGSSTRANTTAPDDSAGVVIEDRFISGSLTQYAAGVEIASDTHALAAGDVTGLYTIGGRASSAFITGYIQGVILINTTLTATQIETLQAWIEHETGLDAITP